jgi:hypothetical protein
LTKTLTALNPTLYSPQNKKTTDATDDAGVKKNVIYYAKHRKNIKTKKLSPLWNQHKYLVEFGGSFRADIRLWRDFLGSSGVLARLQSFEPDIPFVRLGFESGFHPCFDSSFDFNYFIINILIQFIMSKVTVLFSGKTYDTAKQVLTENQIVTGYGCGMSEERYVVHKVELRGDSYVYYLINTETKAITQVDLLRPLREKFGIGFYYNDETPEFMDGFEVAILRSEAEKIADEKRKERQQEQERREQLKTIGKERLQNLVPADVKAVIVAELHEDDSDPMTDYYSYNNRRTVILGFSNHTKDLFSEMRKYAANFEETAHLAEANEKYEHREKYTGGSGYYLGESKYSGWIVKKERYYKDRAAIIEGFALTAGEENNVCIKAQQPDTHSVLEVVTGDFEIVDYSEKALAVFGDTKPIKDELKGLGGRFNPKLTHEDKRKAGWIFAKSKENELRSLLTIK